MALHGMENNPFDNIFSQCDLEPLQDFVFSVPVQLVQPCAAVDTYM